MRPSASMIAAAVLATALAAPAAAQLLGGAQLPGAGALPALPPPPPLDRLTDRLTDRTLGDHVLAPVERLTRADPTAALGRDLLRRNPRLLEADDEGHPVVRGQIVALGVGDAALARALAAGFTVMSRERLPGLDLETLVLAAPKGLAASAAARRLRELDPAGQYDVDPIYFPSGGGAPRRATGVSASPGSGRDLRIGLVDGGADPRAPALGGARLVQQGFAPGGTRTTPHATAIASLLAGDDGAFHGAAPGATVYVADVYGATAAGGSASAVARGVAWLAENRVPVINVSLVGPANALLAAAIARAIARGHLVVAAVGNDGPAAPPLYPAAYPGVVGVTGLDARLRVLPEAGRGPQVAFAAPGADLAAATGAGYAGVRGTSYAAPLVAGLLARTLRTPDPAAAAQAVEALAHAATDLGAPGRDPVFGWGAVAVDLAVRPATLARR